MKKIFCTLAYLSLLFLLGAGILASLARNKAAKTVSSVLRRDNQV